MLQMYEMHSNEVMLLPVQTEENVVIKNIGEEEESIRRRIRFI